MSGLRDIQTGAAFVRLYARDDELRRTLRAAKNRMYTFASAAATAGAGLRGGGSVAATPFGISTTVLAGFEKQRRNCESRCCRRTAT